MKLFGSHLRAVGTFLVLAIALAIASPSTVVAQDNPENSSQQAVRLFNEGQDAHEKGDLPLAIDLYDKALAIIPSFPEAELQKGNAQLSLGLTADAEKSFRKAVELRPDWTLALSSLGSLLASQSRYPEALPIVRKAIELDDQNFPALAALTEILVRTKAPNDEMKVLLSRLVELTGKANPPADIWSARGALENAIGDKKAARASYTNARQVDPANKAAVAGLAEVALSENDLIAAAGLVEQLRVLTKESDDYKTLKARVLAAQNKPDDALKLLASVKQVSDAVLKLRTAIETTRSTDAADLTRRLAADPKNVEILARLCSLQRTSDPAAALEYCRRASELEPQNVNHAIGYGRALVQAKKFEEAVRLMSSLMKFEPENITIRADLATALYELKRYEEAKPLFRWLADKQPDRPIPYYFLAITHDQLQEYIDAMANYQRFLKLADPQGQRLEIDQVNLRLPALQKLIKDKKGKRP